MRWSHLLVVLFYLAVAGTECSFHWYVGHSSAPAASAWRQWYFQKHETNRLRIVQGCVTFVVPGIVLGAAAGPCSRRWSTAESMACIVLLTAGIVILWPLYDMLSRDEESLWLGTSPSQRLYAVVLGAPRVISVVAFFFLFGREALLHGKSGTDEESPKHTIATGDKADLRDDK